MQLNGSDIDELSRELARTLSLDDLERMVHSSTGDRLFVEYVGPGKPLRPTIYDLLVTLEQQGTTAHFLAEVYRNRQWKPEVQALIAARLPEAAVLPERHLPLSLQQGGLAVPGASQDAFSPGLQRNVRPNLAKLDLRIWLERLMEIERRVCRIEISDRPAGTGFLVGPAAVLTNWHVVEKAHAEGRLDRVRCRFGYVRLSDGAREPGEAVALHPDRLLDFSPYGAGEGRNDPDNPPPGPEELDYALLRLAEPVGNHIVEGAARGWLSLRDGGWALEADAPLMIVQHPDGAPMKLAMDTQAVIGPVANGLRVRYRTNTEPGSSGSPCFSMDWDLVALHHYGDPAWKDPLFNQGVPIGILRQRIVARGAGAYLGP